MQRFIYKTLLLILPLVVLAMGMEVLLRCVPNDYQYKKEFLDTHAKNIEILILGNSHSLYALDPIYFEANTFNAAHVSQSLDYDLAILKKYEDEFKNLTTIILPISYFSFFETLESSQEVWRIKNYRIYYDIHQHNNLKHCTEMLSMRLHTNIARIVNYYVLKEPLISCSELGWGTIHLSKDAKDLQSTAIEAAGYHTVKDVSSDELQPINKDNQASLHQILNWSKERNVEVLLITFPAYKSYVEKLNTEQLISTITTTQNISQEYTNCTYLNLLEDSLFVASDYYDADHLSEIGAEKLSKRINAIIDDLH